ncbi:hypothetical protein A0H81_13156 [Grifola frondosa]|uniref:Uncharacterized protein n=1 Tax=Grifola frondosa TaxID=5627 RepID=A0A1C7LRK9_GRIFR|nr:hypothetical protein A0H81_13156 [Grifola frondosa]
MVAAYYSYKAHRYYPQVGNRGKGQNFGVVGLERPDEPPTTYAFVLRESDLVQVTEIPRTRRNKKTSVSGSNKESALKTRILSPSTPRPRTKRTSNSARKAHRQKRAPGDHPSTDTLGTRAVPGELQQPTHIPSLAHQPSAVDLQCALYSDSASGVAARQQSLPTVDVLHPYMHPKPVQSECSPVTPPFQELLLPPCQSAPSTMVADSYAMSWASNFATPSALFSLPVRPPLIAGGYQGVPDASGGIPNHLQANIAPQAMQMRQQLHDCLGVLDHPQMFDVATSPAQMEQQPIYYPPGALGTNEDPPPPPPPPPAFDESNSMHFDTHQVPVQMTHRLPVVPWPTQLIATQNYGHEPNMNAVQSFAPQMPQYAAPYGLPAASQSYSHPTPSNRQLLPDYTDCITRWERSIHRVDIKNDVALQQVPYESHLCTPIPYVSHTSLSNLVPPGNSTIDVQSYASHAAPVAQFSLARRNLATPCTVPRIARSSRGTSRLNLAVDKWNNVCDMQLNVADAQVIAEWTWSNFRDLAI